MKNINKKKLTITLEDKLNKNIMENNRYIRNIQNYNKKLILLKKKNNIKQKKYEIKHKVNYQSLRIPTIIITDDNSKFYFSNDKNEPQKIDVKSFLKMNSSSKNKISKKEKKYYKKKKKNSLKMKSNN